MRRRAEFAVLLATMSLVLMIHPLTCHARAQKSPNAQTRAVAAQPSPRGGAELDALRQQVEKQRQLIETLRGQFEEKRRAVEALATRLDARRAVEDALLTHLEELQQEGQQQRNLIYGAIGAIIVLGVLLNLQSGPPSYRTQNRRVSRIRQYWSALPWR
jgi:hypothetical protein